MASSLIKEFAVVAFGALFAVTTGFTLTCIALGFGSLWELFVRFGAFADHVRANAFVGLAREWNDALTAERGCSS